MRGANIEEWTDLFQFTEMLGQCARSILWFVPKMTYFIYEIPRLIYSHKNHKLTDGIYS